ncbi:hypothetical protein [uncultured Tessaracoccus sp.]|uniref:hypothetical protein n=1 Tax=uncultured Tessaracoccus sp. TaxID=905023 RepID=UPI0025D9E076|nr:hypothetical protein [uncultured Tessaracoccus sp.]
MNRRWGIVLGAVWIAVWGGLLVSRGDWWRSFAQSADAVATASILVWPLAVGFGAAQAVRLVRAGVVERIRAWPGRPVVRVLTKALAATWLPAVGGGVVALVLAAVGGLVSGSQVTAVPLREFVVAALGVAAALLWGWLLGALWPSYAAAAIGPLLVYLALWLLPARFGIGPVAFAGDTMLIGSAVELQWSAVALMALWQLTAALGGAALVVGVLGRRRLLPGVGLGLVATAASVALLVLGPTGRGPQGWVERGPGAWDCRSVGERSTACLPRDIEFLADEYFAAMARGDASLRAVIGPEDTVRYGTATSTLGQPVDTVVFVDTTVSDPVTTWAEYVTSFTAQLPGDGGSDCFAATDRALQMWREILAGQAVNAETVRGVSAEVAGC